MQIPAVLSRLSTLLLAVSTLAFVALAIGPHTGAYRTLTILSDSMDPTFEAGDVIIVVPTPTRSLKAGDVITYEAPIAGRPVVTHRIEKIIAPGSAPVVQTRGDANDAADPWQARLTDDVAWRQVAVIPIVGTVLRTIQRTGAVTLIAFGMPLLLLSVVLHDIWRRPGTSGPVLDDSELADWDWLDESELQRAARPDKQAAA